MTKIIWMTDPHFQNSGTIDGLNPRVRLTAAIDHINTHHGDADFAMLTGDLVGDDIDGDYSAIATYLAKSTVPIYPLMGNNDERSGMRKHLSLPTTAMADFVQYQIAADCGTILGLDTHKVGSAAGEFCEKRYEWLENTLETSGSNPTYIFMHHPPHALGLPPQDEIKMQNGSEFLDVIKRYDTVQHLFMGHVHRPTCGTIRGIPFATLGALSFQAPAPKPNWDWGSFKSPKEPPHYAVVNIENGDVTLQITQFCAYDLGMQS